MWNFKETRAVIDKAGWQYTKDLGEEYGQSPRPKAYDDVSLPRSAHKSYSNQPRITAVSNNSPRGGENERAVEMSSYAEPHSGGDSPRGSPGPSRVPASSTPTTTEPPEYAKVNKNRKKVDDEGEDEADSWV